MRGRGKRRQGKVVTAGHHTMIEKLEGFLPKLEAWPEIRHIRVGAITGPKVGRRHRSVTPGRNRDRASGSGDGFRFRAKGPARVGETVTGIRCVASYGRTYQEVVLTADNLLVLWARLIAEGYAKE